MLQFNYWFFNKNFFKEKVRSIVYLPLLLSYKLYNDPLFVHIINNLMVAIFYEGQNNLFSLRHHFSHLGPPFN
uniref:Uncharacterized protein n=1 Tax=Strongyloides venezuelensis TaxID=75913 RepID=A0A0K0FNM5_STRVS